MILKWGTYAHDAGENTLQINKRELRSPRGYRIGTIERWTIQGVLHAADVAALTTALDSLETAYATGDKVLVLTEDDGTETQHKLDPANTVGGTKVVDFSYPRGEGAEYVTFRSYTIAIEGILDDAESDLISFEESLRFVGTGGPRVVDIEVLNGPAQEQITTAQTLQRIVQSGRAIGYRSYPIVPAPIFPTRERVHLRVIDPGSPQTDRGDLHRYPIRWAYTFASGTPLAGFPNAP